VDIDVQPPKVEGTVQSDISLKKGSLPNLISNAPKEKGSKKTSAVELGAKIEPKKQTAPILPSPSVKVSTDINAPSVSIPVGVNVATDTKPSAGLKIGIAAEEDCSLHTNFSWDNVLPESNPLPRATKEEKIKAAVEAKKALLDLKDQYKKKQK